MSTQEPGMIGAALSQQRRGHIQRHTLYGLTHYKKSGWEQLEARRTMRAKTSSVANSPPQLVAGGDGKEMPFHPAVPIPENQPKGAVNPIPLLPSRSEGLLRAGHS